MSSHDDRDLVLVGAGRMGFALLQGWLGTGEFEPDQIVVIEPHPADALRNLAANSNLTLLTDAGSLNDASPKIIFLAVKPQSFDAALTPFLNVAAKGALVISIAAGKTIGSIEKFFGAGRPIIRAMPNTPAAIGMGITGFFASAAVTDDQKSLGRDLLSAVGQVVELDSEKLIDAVTAVSGSGPAYVFLLMEAMTAAGRDVGLPESVARQLAIATVSGAGELAISADEPPSVLRANVTSPGGTTEAALKVLQSKNGLEDLIKRAVRAAFDRAGELSS